MNLAGINKKAAAQLLDALRRTLMLSTACADTRGYETAVASYSSAYTMVVTLGLTVTLDEDGRHSKD